MPSGTSATTLSCLNSFDPDNDDLFFSWTEVSNNNAVLQNMDSPILNLSELKDGVTYTFRVTVSDQWLSSAAEITLEIGDNITNVNDFKRENNKITIFPNPVKGSRINLSWNELNSDYFDVKIFNMQGGELLRENVFTQNKYHNLEVGSLPSGLYVISFEFSSYKVIEKMLIGF